jgi:NAD(P)-dependent dehydrogenase (short-subunit alcohol dehydrogenase family)
MDLNLSGKRVLITGVSQGIGEGVARAFAEEGSEIHLVARSADKLGKLRDELAASGCRHVRIQSCGDLTTPGAISAVAEVAGDVDILVNNAGAIPSGNLWQVDESKWRAGWELKVFCYINMTRAIYDLMRKRGRGVIINNIGNGGEAFDPHYIVGTTGNAGLMAFTKALGSVSLDDNIRVVGVNPGPVKTERIFNIMKLRAKTMLNDGKRYTELFERFPLKRPAHVREIADLIVFLASYRSSYTSGSIFTVDGGISSRKSVV